MSSQTECPSNGCFVHLENADDFGFESTYSGRSRPDVVLEAKRFGCRPQAILIGTQNAAMNAARGRARRRRHRPPRASRRDGAAVEHVTRQTRPHGQADRRRRPDRQHGTADAGDHAHPPGPADEPGDADAGMGREARPAHRRRLERQLPRGGGHKPLDHLAVQTSEYPTSSAGHRPRCCPSRAADAASRALCVGRSRCWRPRRSAASRRLLACRAGLFSAPGSVPLGFLEAGLAAAVSAVAGVRLGQRR